MGQVEEVIYLHDYDDPYKVLAYATLGLYNLPTIQRILVDDDFVRRLIIKETRSQDFQGRFLDCIIENILTDKQRMEYMHELDKLAQYYFTKLDIERFREEIRKICEECGIELVFQNQS